MPSAHTYTIKDRRTQWYLPKTMLPDRIPREIELGISLDETNISGIVIKEKFSSLVSLVKLLLEVEYGNLYGEKDY